MSLNIITVTLNMDTVNFLGISIVGQSNKGGDGGIYVGSIMKGYVSSVVFKFERWQFIPLVFHLSRSRAERNAVYVILLAEMLIIKGETRVQHKG